MAHLITLPDIALKDSLEEEAIKVLGNETWRFLTQDLQALALDALLVQRVFTKTHYYDGDRDEDGGRITFPLSDIFRDYSFALGGAYKLFEGYVYLVAVKLHIIEPKDLKKYISVGSLTNLPTAKKEYKKMIEDIANTIQDAKVLSRWQALYDTYEDFRNSPAHYSEQMRETYEEVNAEISHILVEIKNMTRYFFLKDMIDDMNKTSFNFPTVSAITVFEEPDYEPDPPEE